MLEEIRRDDGHAVSPGGNACRDHLNLSFVMRNSRDPIEGIVDPSGELTSEEVAREFPDWEISKASSGLWYARLRESTLPSRHQW